MTEVADDTPDKDQSMDDILASIRRIMLDEQARLQDGPAALANAADRDQGADARPDPVLILDSSMVVEGEHEGSLKPSRPQEPAVLLPAERIEVPPAPATVAPATVAKLSDARHPLIRAMPPLAPPAPFAQTTVLGATGAVPVAAEPKPQQADPKPQQMVISAQAIEALMAPAAAAAAAASVDALIKQLSEERLAALQTPAAPPAPTLEDVVRAELRPFLKAWLDEHLPPMVEGLVRAEITRLIGRSGG
jgi:cell pole-organizing protein PopZ